MRRGRLSWSNGLIETDLMLPDSESLLAAIVQSSDDAIVSKTLNGTIVSWNAAATRLFGYERDEILGQSILTLIPEDRHGEEAYIISKIAAGERVEHYETLRKRKDGSLIELSITVSPIFNRQGKVIGASKIARDITDRRRAEEVRRALAREVNHRSKNLLAVVEAIVRQTARNTTPEEVTARISQRLRALSTNQDLLIEGDWQGTRMSDLVASQADAFNAGVGKRIFQHGEDLMISPVAAQALGMALHELAANAIRHGALSAETGKVEVSWGVEEDGQATFWLEWREKGGPLVLPPERYGFGSTILQRLTGQSVGGKVIQSFDPSGMRWRLMAPADMVLVADQMAQSLIF